MTLKYFSWEEFGERHRSGLTLAGGIHRLRQAVPGRPAFLLAPGGRDYMGANSYDEAGQTGGADENNTTTE